MSKIYVVTSGEYSAYGINIVTTKREVAENWIKNHACNKWGTDYVYNYSIEEYDDYDGMDTDLKELQQKELCYKFYANSDTGVDGRLGKNLYYFYESKELQTRYKRAEQWRGKGYNYEFFIHNNDPEKAFKIACDMFAKAEAERLEF